MTESAWHGFKRIDFLFEGREAVLVFPSEANSLRSWLFKMEYLEAFPSFELEMLGRGWHLAFIKNKTRWCLDEDLDLKRRFADFLIEKYSLSKKTVPVGMSCGGLIGTRLAAKYPEYVSTLYLDAPVLNLLSCPAGLGGGKSFMEEFTAHTSMTLKELIVYPDHPINKIPRLLSERIPVVLVYGDEDDVVPYSENGAILERAYLESGGEILTVCKRGVGHHPHGADDYSLIAAFCEEHNKKTKKETEK